MPRDALSRLEPSCRTSIWTAAAAACSTAWTRPSTCELGLGCTRRAWRFPCWRRATIPDGAPHCHTASSRQFRARATLFLQCCAMRCRALLWHRMPCRAMPSCAVLCCAMLRHAIVRNLMVGCEVLHIAGCCLKTCHAVSDTCTISSYDYAHCANACYLIFYPISHTVLPHSLPTRYRIKPTRRHPLPLWRSLRHPGLRAAALPVLRESSPTLSIVCLHTYSHTDIYRYFVHACVRTHVPTYLPTCHVRTYMHTVCSIHVIDITHTYSRTHARMHPHAHATAPASVMHADTTM